jgi:hypothetical protein
LAGQRALSLGASGEAVAHFRDGIEQVWADAGARRCLGVELDLQMGLCCAAGVHYSAGHTDLGLLYERAIELCGQVGRRERMGVLLQGLEHHYFTRADHWREIELWARRLPSFLNLGDHSTVADACASVGRLLYLMGRFRGAKRLLEISRRWVLAHREDYLSFARFPHAWGQTAWTLSLLGYPEQAMSRAEEYVALAEALGHPLVVAGTCWNRAWMTDYLCAGDVPPGRHWQRQPRG